MFYKFLILFVLFPFSAFSTNLHTITWESGVYKKTINKWVGALNNIADIDSSTYIVKKSGGKDKLHVTGHRDAIIWIPKSTNLSKNLTIIVWFHGHWGYVQHRTFENRTLNQLVPLAKKNKNFVLVIPEMPWSVHTKTPTKRNGRLWMQKGSFLDFILQVNLILRKHNFNNSLGKINYKIVGHSAGGSTIARLAITGDLCKINLTKVVWSDSTYGTQLFRAWNGCLKKSDISIDVFTRKYGDPWKRSQEFKQKVKIIPANLTFYALGKPWTHKKIGDNIVKLASILKD